MALVGHVNLDCPVCGHTLHIIIDGVFEKESGALILRPVYDDHDCTDGSLPAPVEPPRAGVPTMNLLESEPWQAKSWRHYLGMTGKS